MCLLKTKRQSGQVIVVISSFGSGYAGLRTLAYKVRYTFLLFLHIVVFMINQNYGVSGYLKITSVFQCEKIYNPLAFDCSKFSFFKMTFKNSCSLSCYNSCFRTKHRLTFIIIKREDSIIIPQVAR